MPHSSLWCPPLRPQARAIETSGAPVSTGRACGRGEGTRGFLSKKYVFYNQINFVKIEDFNIVYSECLTRRATGGTKGSIAFQTNKVCSETKGFQWSVALTLEAFPNFNLKLLYVIQRQIQLLLKLRITSLIKNQGCQFDVGQVIKDKGK